jgi:hypothetical protein
MKKVSSIFPSLFVLSLILVLASCGKETPETAAPTNPAAAPPEAKAEDEWKQIKTFAQSIESVSFVFDESSSMAKLGFQFRNIDVIGSDLVPVFTFISNLQGKVANDGTADLSNPGAKDFNATLKCKDKHCSNADIEITSRSGSLAGKARITQKMVNNPKTASFSFGSFENTETAQSQMLKALGRNFIKSSNFTIREVIDGRKSFFELNLSLSNSNNLPQDANFFDSKTFTLSGEIGTKVLVRLTCATLKGGLSTVSSTPYTAEVIYDANRAFVSTRFIENATTKEVESSLVLTAEGK